MCVHNNHYISYSALPSTRRSHVKRSFEGLFILELPLQLFKPHNMCSTALHVITISKPSMLQQAYIYIWPTFVSLVSFWAFAQVWGFSLLLFPASLFALWSRPRYPKLLRSWNLHLMQTRFVQAMPALIRSNFHASVIPGSSGNLGSCTHRPKFLSSSTMAFTRQLYLLNVESLALIYLYLINNLKWCSRITLFFKKQYFS